MSNKKNGGLVLPVYFLYNTDMGQPVFVYTFSVDKAVFFGFKHYLY